MKTKVKIGTLLEKADLLIRKVIKGDQQVKSLMHDKIPVKQGLANLL